MDMAAGAGRVGRPMTPTVISWASSPSTSADVRASGAFNGGLAQARPFHLRDGQNTPPLIGRGTPVVVGREIGRPRRERNPRYAKHCASMLSPSEPIASNAHTV